MLGGASLLQEAPDCEMNQTEQIGISMMSYGEGLLSPYQEGIVGLLSYCVLYTCTSWYHFI
jgi:hypothetical protein